MNKPLSANAETPENTETLQLCPRCKVNRLSPNEAENSLSRTHPDIFICNDCGNDEGFEDYFQPVQRKQW